jgi:hypothetical protein
MAKARQRKSKEARRAHHAKHRTVVPLFEHLADIAENRRPMPDSDAKFQHYIPQLHLRGFSANPRPAKNALIWRLDKATGEIEEKRVARVGGDRGFNRVKGADDKSTNFVEAWLGIVEHHAAPAIERLLTSPARLRFPDRITIAFYLAMQEMRTPHGLANIKNASDTVFDAHVALWTHDPDMFAELCRDAGVTETSDAVERVRELMQQPGYIQLADDRGHAFDLAMSIVEDLTNAIGPKTWTLLQGDSPLVVADHPISHVETETPLYPWIEPTWSSSPTVRSFIPLTSQSMLQLSHPGRRNERDYGTGRLTDAETAVANLRGYGWATRYVFAAARATLEQLHSIARSAPEAVPRASRQFQVITADERAFLPSEPNQQPSAWPAHVPRRGKDGSVEWCRYRVVAHDQPDEIRAAVEWSLNAEQRLHPGERPDLILGASEDLELLRAAASRRASERRSRNADKERDAA